MKDRQSLLAQLETLFPLAVEHSPRIECHSSWCFKPGYILYHDNEKIVIRNYEGKIFEYPEIGGDESVQFAPQCEWSRWESSDIDGQAVRPNERERVSQYHDE